jgi:hypothetical protein
VQASAVKLKQFFNSVLNSVSHDSFTQSWKRLLGCPLASSDVWENHYSALWRSEIAPVESFLLEHIAVLRPALALYALPGDHYFQADARPSPERDFLTLGSLLHSLSMPGEPQQERVRWYDRAQQLERRLTGCM